MRGSSHMQNQDWYFEFAELVPETETAVSVVVLARATPTWPSLQQEQALRWLD